MKKFVAFGLGLLWAGAASAQNLPAPSLEYFLSPSIGQAWQPPGMWGVGNNQFNAQTGTSYTIAATDMGKVVTFNNGSPIAVTLPVATTAGFEASKCFWVITIGAGTVTVTPTTSTINGQTTKTFATNASGRICSDGTNYYTY